MFDAVTGEVVESPENDKQAVRDEETLERFTRMVGRIDDKIRAIQNREEVLEARRIIDNADKMVGDLQKRRASLMRWQGAAVQAITERLLPKRSRSWTTIFGTIRLRSKPGHWKPRTEDDQYTPVQLERFRIAWARKHQRNECVSIVTKRSFLPSRLGGIVRNQAATLPRRLFTWEPDSVTVEIDTTPATSGGEA